jgi:nitrogen PTS system EIIA component
MNLADILDHTAVLANVKAQTKKALLQDLSQALATQVTVDARKVFEVLNTREKLGSTGLGHGIAIPHGRLPGLSRVHGLFARLATPIAFDSVDGEPVDLVFALLAPAHAGADHLTALARISRLLREPRTLAKLRGTESAESLYAILTEPPTATAA